MTGIDIRTGTFKRKIEPGVHFALLVKVDRINKDVPGAGVLPGLEITFRVDNGHPTKTKAYFSQDDQGYFISPKSRLYKLLYKIFSGNEAMIRALDFTSVVNQRYKLMMVEDLGKDGKTYVNIADIVREQPVAAAQQYMPPQPQQVPQQLIGQPAAAPAPAAPQQFVPPQVAAPIPAPQIAAPAPVPAPVSSKPMGDDMAIDLGDLKSLFEK